MSAASRTAYVLLPFVFSGLPLGMLTATALSIRASDRPMERRDAERLENGLPPRALFAAVLSGAALLAQGLRFLLTEEAVWPGDAVFALGAAGVSVCAAAAFSRRKALSVQKEGPPAP